MLWLSAEISELNIIWGLMLYRSVNDVILVNIFKKIFKVYLTSNINLSH